MDKNKNPFNKTCFPKLLNFNIKDFAHKSQTLRKKNSIDFQSKKHDSSDLWISAPKTITKSKSFSDKKEVEKVKSPYDKTVLNEISQSCNQPELLNSTIKFEKTLNDKTFKSPDFWINRCPLSHSNESSKINMDNIPIFKRENHKTELSLLNKRMTIHVDDLSKFKCLSLTNTEFKLDRNSNSFKPNQILNNPNTKEVINKTPKRYEIGGNSNMNKNLSLEDSEIQSNHCKENENLEISSEAFRNCIDDNRPIISDNKSKNSEIKHKEIYSLINENYKPALKKFPITDNKSLTNKSLNNKNYKELQENKVANPNQPNSPKNIPSNKFDFTKKVENLKYSLQSSRAYSKYGIHTPYQLYFTRPYLKLMRKTHGKRRKKLNKSQTRNFLENNKLIQSPQSIVSVNVNNRKNKFITEIIKVEQCSEEFLLPEEIVLQTPRTALRRVNTVPCKTKSPVSKFSSSLKMPINIFAKKEENTNQLLGSCQLMTSLAEYPDTPAIPRKSYNSAFYKDLKMTRENGSSIINQGKSLNKQPQGI